MVCQSLNIELTIVIETKLTSTFNILLMLLDINGHLLIEWEERLIKSICLSKHFIFVILQHQQPSAPIKNRLQEQRVPRRRSSGYLNPTSHWPQVFTQFCWWLDVFNQQFCQVAEKSFERLQQALEGIFQQFSRLKVFLVFQKTINTVQRSKIFSTPSTNKVKRVEIIKNNPVLGMVIEGGRDTSQKEPRIVNIQPGGQAFETAGLRVGQVIKQVDGHLLTGERWKQTTDDLLQTNLKHENFFQFIRNFIENFSFKSWNALQLLIIIWSEIITLGLLHKEIAKLLWTHYTR